jgi:hypothetical protein
MRIYQVSFGMSRSEDGDDDGMGTQLRWFSSKREAEQSMAAMKRDRLLSDAIPAMVTPYDIPNTKQGLIDWLNVHFNSDNG